MSRRNNNGESATKLIFPLFVLLGLLIMIGVPFLISIFILIFLGAVLLLYKNKSEIAQRFPASSRFTAKIPSVKKAVGWTMVAVILVILVIVIAQSDFLRGGTITSDASLEQQLGGWEADGGAKVAGNRFVLPADSSLTRHLDEADIASVALVNLEGDGTLEILVEDTYDYSENFGCSFQRNAKFTFTVTEEGISSSNMVEFGNSMEEVELKWHRDEVVSEQDGIFVSCAVDTDHLVLYYGKAKKFSEYIWEINPAGYRGRGIVRPYKVAIENTGEKEISMDVTLVDPERPDKIIPLKFW